MVTIRVVDHTGLVHVSFPASPDEPLLDQIEARCAWAVPSVCAVGVCGTCALEVLQGSEHLERDAFGIGATDLPPEGLVLPCVAAIRTPAGDGAVVLRTGACPPRAGYASPARSSAGAALSGESPT